MYSAAIVDCGSPLDRCIGFPGCTKLKMCPLGGTVVIKVPSTRIMEGCTVSFLKRLQPWTPILPLVLSWGRTIPWHQSLPWKKCGQHVTISSLHSGQTVLPLRWPDVHPSGFGFRSLLPSPSLYSLNSTPTRKGARFTKLPNVSTSMWCKYCRAKTFFHHWKYDSHPFCLLIRTQS